MEYKFKIGDTVRTATPEEFGKIFAMTKDLIAGGFSPGMLNYLGAVAKVTWHHDHRNSVGYFLDNGPLEWDERLLFLVERKPAKNEVPKDGPTRGVLQGVIGDFTANIRFRGAKTKATIRARGKRYVGVAKCSPQDTWNQEKGAKIATIRALMARLQGELDDLCK